MDQQYKERTPAERKAHAEKLMADLDKILNEACCSCVNSLFCYQQNKDGTLKKNHTKCSKMTFERKIELIGFRCNYHPTINPKGWNKPTESKGVPPL